jgi:hypothetical protein
MKSHDSIPADTRQPARSDLELLRQLDLATEVLEGLEELGVRDREELLALMEALERQIADED